MRGKKKEHQQHNNINMHSHTCDNLKIECNVCVDVVNVVRAHKHMRKFNQNPLVRKFKNAFVDIRLFNNQKENNVSGVCVCVYVYMCVCVYVCLCVYVCMLVRVCVCMLV